ncbi:alpha helical protein [Streptomyces sp. YIM 98790]|uniref:alpha helical protein n=1 Tax=Streptomyces sp. YIM 98790 TaxID=2689077 RepID=UPI00140C628A|nr:alpha helical protein [Streptomyces sp. YIM 98790]
MTAKAGEKARKTGDFFCAECSAKVHVDAGDEIPACPNGHKEFATRRHEPDTRT